jgi:hypothetical protein
MNLRASGTLRTGARALTGIAALTAAALLGPLAAGAWAVSLPTASTGAAKQVGYASAVLDGSVDPKGSDTSYYFQYGPTKAYGGQTAIADAGAGTHAVPVSLSVAGLQPLTVYHYRLVAVNARGAANGADRSLLTTKVPLSLQILASPDPVLYGEPVTVQGTLSGTGNDNRAVTLQANSWPFAAGFQNIGNPELTTATGGFSFPILGLAQATQYRVVTSTTPPVLSPVAVENVAVRVLAHVGPGNRRRHSVRFYGTVTPAEDGMQVGILRIIHGRGVLAAGATLRHHTVGTSTFSRLVHVTPGVYRVLVRVMGGAQVSNYSEPLVIRR